MSTTRHEGRGFVPFVSELLVSHVLGANIRLVDLPLLITKASFEMKSFSVTPSEGLVITGLASIPPPSPILSSHRPLVVFLHGGSYASDYYDSDPERSIEPLSTTLGIPVISLNRQGYKDSTLPVISEGQTSLREQSKNLHTSILPAIWEDFGKPAGASSIVLAGHSIGGMIGVMVAALYATSSSPRGYPLSGLCTTGITDRANPRWNGVEPPPLPQTGKHFNWPDEVRDAMMLNGQVSADFATTHSKLNNPAPVDEVIEATSRINEWRVCAKDVEVPVLGLAAEHDALWDTSKAAMDDFARLFEKTTAEIGIVTNAPHCLEISYQARPAFLKVLGHAVQCARAHGMEKESEKEMK
ncbi:uncharacterized protein BDR25DRAFT_309177 [Lindgomyces ingoldianus]|uniref:Uncharacterized protein n=1 Tax=Lindgomyces ingoldianus TaxID=673940 RepID=A0ACB6RCD3_9PLEO|nr:uncharacterized protein BDR25DRAFT_309177 [Lindgomyces ingoldianus]KAF2476816.1 hypothetical protein BDR25DRAFT_309177 [Lindgomyces ingoldianus]